MVAEQRTDLAVFQLVCFFIITTGNNHIGEIAVIKPVCLVDTLNDSIASSPSLSSLSDYNVHK